ncbi:hypothetical protein ACO2Q8_16625 [Larkinella sp. VNQ87]|uniref:hypothetical protein n=1 Tax=Larkinella sp. VNQ87 TaxID=3400921 RepID=UPI003BFE6760
MSPLKLFLIGALEFAYLVVIVLKLTTSLIGLSWYWIFAPIWFPVVGFLLLMFHLAAFGASVILVRFVFNRLKSAANQ